MCGIAGLLSKKKNKLNINKINKIMSNRGPDQQGHFHVEKKNFFLNLFSSRLKIIDLNDRSNQPFLSDEFVLIYNGEIYNFLDIRKDLLESNFIFKTMSDTEVVINAYKKWGIECVNKFDGMWAFAIYDQKKNKLILSRDFFGEKPLFFYRDNQNIIFGSEIKYIFELYDNDYKLNLDKINEFLSNGYRSINKNTESFFKNIYHVKPGEIIEINLNNFSIDNKSNCIFNKNDIPQNENEIEDYIKDIFFNEYKKRLRADVPIAYCLSGGVDSSSLVSIAKKKFDINPKCFSIIMKDERYNELQNIEILKKKLNLNIDFIEIPKLNFSDFLTKVSKLIEYKSAPISTISYYAHSYISEQCKKQDFKVIMSGTGADEIFTGYYDHHLFFLGGMNDGPFLKKEMSYFKKYVEPKIRNKLIKYENFKNKNKFTKHIYDNVANNKVIKNLIKNDFHENLYSDDILRNRMLNEIFHESVPVMLYEDDSNSMLNSIENRSPFLSKKLFNAMFSVDTKFLIKNGYSKYILRKITKDILPDEIRLDRNKIGFNASLYDFVDFNYSIIEDFVKKNTLLKDMINLHELKKIFNQKTLSNSSNKALFNIINLGVMLEKN